MVFASWGAAFRYWRYRRWVDRLPAKRLARLRSYWWRIHTIEWHDVSPRHYLQHRIVTRTLHLNELLTTTQRIYRLIEQHRIDQIDRFNSNYRSPQDRLLDDYFFTVTGQTPSFRDTVEKCKTVLHPLIAAIEGVEFENQELYRFYEQSGAYLVDDWLEVLDVMYALHLEIPHERRRRSAAHTRRDPYTG